MGKLFACINLEGIWSSLISDWLYCFAKCDKMTSVASDIGLHARLTEQFAQFLAECCDFMAVSGYCHDNYVVY